MSPTTRGKRTVGTSEIASNSSGRVTRSRACNRTSTATTTTIAATSSNRGRRGTTRRRIQNPPIPEVSTTMEPEPADVTPPEDAPRSPQINNQNNVSVVDLITPRPPAPQPRIPSRRPLEVDLTCDLDDEVFVVLEDIVNPSRRSNPELPVILGTSPQRTRVPGSRRHYLYASGQAQQSVTTPTGEGIELIPSSTEEKAGNSSQTEAATTGIHCPICLDTLSQIKEAKKQIHSTICGHLFCGPCINKVVITTHQCPTCRHSLDLRKVHPIFI